MSITATPRPPFHFHRPLWFGAAALLAVPAAAMLFTREMTWGPEDFAAMGLMLAALCLAVEGAWHLLDTRAKRLSAIAVAVLVFFTVWAELAVGLFD